MARPASAFDSAGDEPVCARDHSLKQPLNRFAAPRLFLVSALASMGALQLRITPFICAAIVAATIPAVARADDPRDPSMRSAQARARDRGIIRQLNLEEGARVRARDARYAKGWREYANRSKDEADYARSRAQYERDMAAWRHAVAACRAGDYSACGN